MRRPLVTVMVVLTAVAARAGYQSRLLCSFNDPQINESSGIAAAGRSDDYFFTHNDSGDTARIFAVNRQGRTVATLNVPGARNVDWEDVAATHDGRGEPVLLL